MSAKVPYIKKLPKIKRLLVNLLCCFVPSKSLRHEIRDSFFHDIWLERYNMLLSAVVDENGYGMLEAMMYNANIKDDHKDIFYGIKDNDVCIDCGANTGLITDIILKLGGICYAFEPSISAFNILTKKYKDSGRVKLMPMAVSDKKGEAVFYTDGAADAGATIFTGCHKNKKESYKNKKLAYPVQAIRLVEFINTLLVDNDEIYLLKLDVEGSEFDILADIIKTGSYKKIRYILCETHECYFEELIPKKEHIRTLLQKENITNIYLDWV